MICPTGTLTTPGSPRVAYVSNLLLFGNKQSSSQSVGTSTRSYSIYVRSSSYLLRWIAGVHNVASSYRWENNMSSARTTSECVGWGLSRSLWQRDCGSRFSLTAIWHSDKTCCFRANSTLFDDLHGEQQSSTTARRQSSKCIAGNPAQQARARRATLQSGRHTLDGPLSACQLTGCGSPSNIAVDRHFQPEISRLPAPDVAQMFAFAYVSWLRSCKTVIIIKALSHGVAELMWHDLATKILTDENACVRESSFVHKLQMRTDEFVKKIKIPKRHVFSDCWKIFKTKKKQKKTCRYSSSSSSQSVRRCRQRESRSHT